MYVCHAVGDLLSLSYGMYLSKFSGNKRLSTGIDTQNGTDY